MSFYTTTSTSTITSTITSKGCHGNSICNNLFHLARFHIFIIQTTLGNFICLSNAHFVNRFEPFFFFLLLII